MDRNGYTFLELTDVHLAYGEALGNAVDCIKNDIQTDVYLHVQCILQMRNFCAIIDDVAVLEANLR